jgi:hypothetical protein
MCALLAEPYDLDRNDDVIYDNNKYFTDSNVWFSELTIKVGFSCSFSATLVDREATISLSTAMAILGNP